MESQKEYLDHPELIAHLKRLGLEVQDEVGAERELRRIGYHRSASYRYPFRRLLPEDQQIVPARTFRADEFVDGARFEHAIALADFDTKLREVVLRGTLDYEVRLRTAVAHVLARRDPLAHLRTIHLDEYKCNAAAKDKTKFEAWLNTYESAIEANKADDFIAHHFMTRGRSVPVWGTVEVLSFGSLPMLMELMREADQNEVARRFGVKQGGRHSAWTRAVVDLRNSCAHGARLFNANLKRPIKVTKSVYVGDNLDHLAEMASPPEALRRKLYWVSAVLAHMLSSHESGSQWPRSFATQVKKLPVIELPGAVRPHLSEEQDMGFINAWRELPLWNSQP